jgi:CRISPR system Cascade subunit CasA
MKAPTMVHNLLDEGLISCRDHAGQIMRETLPGILARLTRDEIRDFLRVRPHQYNPWCMFVTQLAAIALHAREVLEPPETEPEWRELLLNLTEGSSEPWCLIVSDLQRPAFLQPPVPEGSVDSWKSCPTPDQLDILVTSKNHDVKMLTIKPDDTEAWIYALVTLQTMQGYPGRGYNPIARMKGGYGNRPRVGITANDVSHALSTRFLRDVSILLDEWPRIVERGFSENGIGLVWLAPWDGKASLEMQDLSPHFIEICSRVRFHKTESSAVCRYTTTQSRRCLSQVTDGDVGDIWIPVERGKGVLTVGGGGFRYPLVARVLFSADFQKAPAQLPKPKDGDTITVNLWAMVRGQGQTEGLHEKNVVIRGKASREFRRPEGRERLGKRSIDAINLASTMRQKVLFPALKALTDDGKGSNTMIPDNFDARVDDIFFDSLFDTYELDDEEARKSWILRLEKIASNEVEEVFRKLNLPYMKDYRVISKARGVFGGCLKKNFPDLFTRKQNDDVSEGETNESADF